MYELRTKEKENIDFENLFYFCDLDQKLNQMCYEFKPIDKGANLIIEHLKKMQFKIMEFSIESVSQRNEIKWLEAEIERLKMPWWKRLLG